MFYCFLKSYITYRSCRHLDNKHTVFGQVVGGLDILQVMEHIEVDNKDRPIEDIVIIKAQIFVDPYQEADEQVYFRNSITFLFNVYFSFFSSRLCNDIRYFIVYSKIVFELFRLDFINLNSELVCKYKFNFYC